MIPLADLLQPSHVELQPSASGRQAAIREIAALLKDDPSVLSWDELHAAMQVSAPCIVEQFADFGVCIPHARTNGVTAVTMSAGRFEPGLQFEGVLQPIRYVFCVGAPHAMATDYLRIVGLLARIVKDPKTEQQIRAAATAEEFVETLSRLEAEL